MKLEELVNQNYDKLTVNDHEILNYILSHQTEAALAGCEKLAFNCHVSKTTLLRFCRKLGLDSYAELKLFLKPELEHNKSSHMDMLEISQSYHEMIDEIRERDYRDICGAIVRAETIYIYGTGNAQKAEAEEFKRIFLSVGKCVIDLFDLGEVNLAKGAFRSSDLFFIISLSGETKDGINILKSIRETGIETVSITRWDNNTISRMCGKNLYVGTKTVQGYQNLSYEMTAAFYVLLDILFVSYLDNVERN